jgi:hypothetical protein
MPMRRDRKLGMLDHALKIYFCQTGRMMISFVILYFAGMDDMIGVAANARQE